MANSIDQLQIDIVAQDKATDTIDALSRSIQALGEALANLDAGKMKSLARSLDNLNINVNLGSVPESISNIGDAAAKSAEQVEQLTGQLDKVERIIYGNEIKDFQRGFTMKNAPAYKGVEYPPAVVDTTPIDAQTSAYEEKLLPAIIDTENQVDELYRRMMNVSSVEAVYDAITEKFIEWKTHLMEMNGAISGDKWIVPEFTGNADFSRQQVGWISDIQPQVVEGYFYEIEDAANKCLPAIVNVGTTALATADQFKQVEDYARNAYLSTHFEEAEKPLETINGQLTQVNSKIGQAIQNARAFKQVISDMESGKAPFDDEAYRQAIKGYNRASEEIKKYKDALIGSNKNNKDAIVTLVALGGALGQLSNRLDGVANKFIGLFKLLTTPLRMAAKEYVEKFEHMSESVKDFRARVQVHLNKMSAFWKRTMKTFTFMLVRKAITAVIKEVGTAVQSLAMFSNAMGTQFNNSISTLVADFQYLGRSIVSVFAPILDAVAPIIDAIVDKIALLLSYVGMLMAALTGADTFTKAKKTINNYADSLDNASKSAKKLTMGIDELNILNENTNGKSNAYDGWEDAWEQVDVPDWIKSISDDMRKTWERFFDPLKTAWDNASTYVISGFKSMLNSLKDMFGSIGDDFLEVWNQDRTIKMFEQLFKVIGDIERTVRNLADNFKTAWEEGSKGKDIFENLRDILDIIIGHVRDVSFYMSQWAKGIDFNDVLIAFDELAEQLKPFADFVGGVFEDIMREGVLKYVEYLIEKAIPHLLETIGEISNAFNFPDLRRKLKPVWGAFEELFENIHGGITNAIGNLGKEIARFTRSDDFTKFLEQVVNISKLVTKERVEKVLTGLGTGILNIAKAVVKFVSSDTFLKFLQAIANWIDKTSTDRIAGTLEAIAIAIAGFKFAAFATDKLSGFFQFFTVLTAMKNLKNIAGELTTLSGSVGKLAGTSSELAKVSSDSVGLFSKFSSSVKDLGGKFLDLHNNISPLVGLLGSVATAFGEFQAVSKYVEDLTYKIGKGEDGLAGSIVGIVASLGIAEAAFIALLGVPAGVVAGLVVGTIAAINGINDAIEQLNFDRITDAIMTQGDTTIEMVDKWYNQATEIVNDSVNEWKEIERTLTSDRDDIESYAKSLEGLSAALDSNTTLTVGMADTLVGKYESLSDAIGKYIDDSTESIVMNLLAQREYLEAKGYDVDQMIADIYMSANAEKSAIDEAIKAMHDAYDEYARIVEESGADSQAAIDAYGRYVDAAHDAGVAVQGYISAVEDIDTSEAVDQIKNLGESLDLSNYGTDWESAKEDITKSIDGIQSTYETGMEGINETYKDKVDELNLYASEHPWFTEEMYNASLANIEKSTNEAKETLITATSDALNLYSQALTDKMAEVAQKADEDYNKMPWWEKWFSDQTKQEYILSQEENYINNILGGTNGLQGKLTSAYKSLYEELPNATAPDVEKSMKGILDNEASYFIENSDGTKTRIIDTQKDMLTAILDEVENVDYQTPAYYYATEQYNALDSALKDNKPDSLGGDYISGLFDGMKKKYNELIEVNPVGLWLIDRFRKDTETHSPSKKASEIGSDFIAGLFQPFNSLEMTTIQTFINTFINCFKSGLSEKTFSSIGEGIVRGLLTPLTSSIDKTEGVITNIFKALSGKVNEGVDNLADELSKNKIPTFFKTVIEPYATPLKWQPIFDILRNKTMKPAFENFRKWFTESMKTWWNTDVKTWFTDTKWDIDIFNKLKANIQRHFKNFLEWWRSSIKSWWNNDVITMFKESLWENELKNITNAASRTFSDVKSSIRSAMQDAQRSVASSCREMQSSLRDVSNAIQDVLNDFNAFSGIEGSFSFSFSSPNQFATGGFPSYGSLFVAGEPGARTEWVGNIGGRTGVVSNGEITGIADAVYATGNTETQLLSQLIQVSRQILDKDPVVLGDRDIAMMSNRGQSKLGMNIIT